jgi:excisionase family DNA binding protein
MQAQPAAPTGTGAAVPEVLTPEQAAQMLAVAVEDVVAAIDAGELKARRIGTAYRIARTALDEYLRGA